MAEILLRWAYARIKITPENSASEERRGRGSEEERREEEGSRIINR